MTLYNVLVGVVELVEADSPEAAIEKLSSRVIAAGFDTHGDGTTQLPHAFESEPQS